MRSKFSTLIASFVLMLSMAISSTGFAKTIDEVPSALAMTSDAVFVRPVLLAITLVGTVVFVGSLPLSALGGNVNEAAKVLMIDPAKATFIRCLGCTISGRSASEIIKQKSK